MCSRRWLAGRAGAGGRGGAPGPQGGRLRKARPSADGRRPHLGQRLGVAGGVHLLERPSAGRQPTAGEVTTQGRQQRTADGGPGSACRQAGSPQDQPGAQQGETQVADLPIGRRMHGDYVGGGRRPGDRLKARRSSVAGGGGSGGWRRAAARGRPDRRHTPRIVHPQHAPGRRGAKGESRGGRCLSGRPLTSSRVCLPPMLRNCFASRQVGRTTRPTDSGCSPFSLSSMRLKRLEGSTAPAIPRGCGRARFRFGCQVAEPQAAHGAACCLLGAANIHAHDRKQAKSERSSMTGSRWLPNNSAPVPTRRRRQSCCSSWSQGRCCWALKQKRLQAHTSNKPKSERQH